MKNVFLLSLMLAFFFSSLAQDKPALSHDDYDQWESLSNIIISKNGKWLAYQIDPQDGDATAAWASSKNPNSKTILKRGYRFQFSNNSDFLIGRIKPQEDTIRSLKLAGKKSKDFPKDSLFVASLETGSVSKKPHIKSFELPADDGNYYAALFNVKPEKGKKARKDSTQLIISTFATDSIASLAMVEKYQFADNGKYLYAIQKSLIDSLDQKTLWLYNTETRGWQVVDSTMTNFSQLAFSKDASKLAYIATSDSVKNKKPHLKLYSFDIESKQRELIANGNESELLPKGRISADRSLKFSENGEALFFGLRDDYKSYAYVEDSTLLKTERVSLDIWSWKDSRLQSEQKIQLRTDLKKSYLAVYNYPSKKLVQLADRDIDLIMLPSKINSKYLIAYNTKPYKYKSAWEARTGADIYLVDISNGEKTLFQKEMLSYPKISPDAQYLSWYDYADSTWYCYNIESKTSINLTGNIKDKFAEQGYDRPSLPSSYGSAGWLKNDEAIILYSEFDIWRIDPKHPEEAVNLTKGAGKKQKVKFWLQQLNLEETSIDPKNEKLFYAYSEETKDAGYYKGSLLKAQEPKQIVMSANSYKSFVKAKESDEIIFQRADFTHSPDIYVSNSKLSNIKQVSAINAQQKNYNWGTTELMKYESLAGDSLDALVFKPENFDPKKKYPVMVYFYEKYSNNLNLYFTPKPSASTINIPYFISNEYIVLVPDIVYTTGEPGKSAYNCVMGATKQLMKEAYIDSDNMGLQGQSWGGYQVAYIITQTDLFKAAGAGAAVVNMTSAYGGIRWGSGKSRMFMYEQTQSRIGSSLWEDPDAYIRNSPLFYADKINTPVLIVHNDKDDAVPWSQGIEFFLALKRNQNPAWLLVYNGERHNLRQRKNRKDLSIRLSQFFDHYLKGAPSPKWMSEGIPAIEKGKTLKYELDQ